MVSRTVEGELAMLIGEARLDARQGRAVAVRLGWDGGGGTTLEEAGRREGYTRERVRQLEERLRRGLQATKLRLPLIRAAVELVERAAPDRRDHIAMLLPDAGLTSAPFDPAGVLSAAAMAGLGRRVSIRRDLVLSDDREPVDGQAVKLARRLARKEGVVGLQRLAREVGLEPDRLRRLFGNHPEVSWLGKRQEWLQLGEPGRPMVRVLEKMLAFSDPLTLDEAEDALRRACEPVLLSRDALLVFCESCAWLRVDRDRQTISAAAVLDRNVVLSPVEQRLATIFRTAGPVLTAGQAIELGARHGLNRNTVGVYLSRSPIIRRFERGRYTLFGHVMRSPALAVS